jgi:hypothetical protein
MDDKEALRAALNAILKLTHDAEPYERAVRLHSIDIPILIAATRRKVQAALSEMDGQHTDVAGK